jgi:hypothetical protein
MPEGTPVDRLYKALKRKGKSDATAAKISQAVTHLSLQTGEPPKGKVKIRRKKQARLPGW